MSELELQKSIIQSLQGLTFNQQQKLLEFINAMVSGGEKVSSKPSKLTQFAGILSETEAKEWEDVIKDYN